MKSAILLSASYALCVLTLMSSLAYGGGLPEPGLIMYGALRNAANGNARLTSGTLTATITPPTGSPVTISTSLTDISGQFSYVLRVPFETIVGSAALSPNTLQLSTAITSYLRTNMTLTVSGTNCPATITAPALGTFPFSTSDRGRMERVDLAVTAPGLGAALVKAFFASPPTITNATYQLTVSGALGQTYTVLASTDLVNWTPLSTFICTNTTMLISDPLATNSTSRFYRFDQ